MKKINSFYFCVDKETKCMDATSLCEAYGKSVAEWEELPRTKELIKFFSDKKKPFHYYEKDQRLFLIKELFFDVAIWISIECFTQCVEIFSLLFDNL